ncbi:protein trichome birefringence-like 43 [Beta vulgaris subsp. vulgaris]|uniref:protein trichome birefringence-like 43 n=1 Tax=Beta vulgaris subsp. vulgaris TaxID=3555 RepID=UPI0020376637|nr:protein trichome birefringence-like 43 [Beta vulgaris subsp. vulgaris]
MENSVFAMLLLLVMVVSGEQCLKNNYVYKGKITRRKENNYSSKSCDLYTGKWVHDSSYPLYEASNCPFFEKQFGCEKNGRPDTNYLKFRWKPSHCLLPRFDGGDFLTRLRGKRMLFVGDSISLNQWQSLACMLHTSVPQADYKLARSGGLSEFTFPAYNTSLMLLRDGFLIKIVNKKVGRVLVLNSVSQGKSWKNFDILIFNTWHWWLHTGRKQPWDYIQDGDKMYKDMDRLVAYEKGLKTWARWVDLHLKSTNSKVFFQGVSPDHMNALNWTAPNARTCIGVTQPLVGATNNAIVEHNPAERIVEKVVREMERPVHLLKVTPLSQLRRDGHPGIYGIGRHRLPDCSHWCLPGVPDTWNHLLYASLYS